MVWGILAFRCLAWNDFRFPEMPLKITRCGAGHWNAKVELLLIFRNPGLIIFIAAKYYKLYFSVTWQVFSVFYGNVHSSFSDTCHSPTLSVSTFILLQSLVCCCRNEDFPHSQKSSHISLSICYTALNGDKRVSSAVNCVICIFIWKSVGLPRSWALTSVFVCKAICVFLYIYMSVYTY